MSPKANISPQKLPQPIDVSMRCKKEYLRTQTNSKQKLNYSSYIQSYRWKSNSRKYIDVIDNRKNTTT